MTEPQRSASPLPGSQPPGSQPPGSQPPGSQPPGSQPPGSQLAQSHWQLLDPWMLAVSPLRGLLTFLPVIVLVLLVGGGDLGTRLFAVVVAGIAVIIAGMLRWLTTRYRITEERVELRSGLLYRSARSVPRDRIRSVDLTAGPAHRLFGLSVVKVGTGEAMEGIESRELTLDAVSSTEADRLRRLLLDRLYSDEGPDQETTGDAAGPAAAQHPPPATKLAALNWSWLRYAPLTASSLVAVGAVAGGLFQLTGDLGIEPTRITEIPTIGEQFGTAALWLGLTLLAFGLLVIAVLGALLIFVEAWWGFRLVRERGGTLRIRRGLLTTRSVSLEERRLRGVELGEPLLLRAGRGARLTAVATGLGGGPGHGRGDLLPPAPLDEAHRVAGLVLREDPSPTRTALRRHPLAALRRRLVRAALPVLVLLAVLWLVRAPQWTEWLAFGLLAGALLLAVDAYRNLGHNLAEHYLVARHGTGVRRTAALQRTGVIGWRISQSLLQRQARLLTVTATTAAGSGAYHVIDVGTSEGLAFADEAVPGLLRPFLLPAEAEYAGSADRPITH